MSFGTYPALSLKDARALRDEARSLLAKGVNPHSERKRRRHAIVLAGEHTFMVVYEQWLAASGGDLERSGPGRGGLACIGPGLGHARHRPAGLRAGLCPRGHERSFFVGITVSARRSSER